MVVALVILVVFGIYQTDSVQEFRANSNHNPVYKIVRGVPCDYGPEIIRLFDGTHGQALSETGQS